jgi:hypothetical protein
MEKELEKVNDMTWMNMTRSPTVDSKKKDYLGIDHRGVNELCSRATQDASLTQFRICSDSLERRSVC